MDVCKACNIRKVRYACERCDARSCVYCIFRDGLNLGCAACKRLAENVLAGQQQTLSRADFVRKLVNNRELFVVFAHYGSFATSDKYTATSLGLVPEMKDGEFDYTKVLETLRCLLYTSLDQTLDKLEEIARSPK